MPNFTWDIDPVAIEIAKSNLVLALGGFAGLMLVLGLIRRQSDLSVFGLFLGAVVLLLNNFVPDPVGIRYYSLLFVGVFLGGYALLNWQILRGGGDEEAAGDFIVYGVAGVLIGSRLGHVLFYDLDKAIEDPLWIFQIWTGGLASHGAVIGLIIAMWLFTKRRGVPFLEGADRFAFSAALGATLVRLGNFFNSEIVGRVVPDQSWGVRFPRFDVHMAEAPLRYPSQLFEVFLGLLVLACLYGVDRATGKEQRPRGLLISVFFLVYFAGRFSVEFFKEFQTLEPTDNLLTMGQILSIPGFFIGVGGVIASLKYRLPSGWISSKPALASTIASDAEDQDSEESEEDGDKPTGARVPATGKLYDPDVDAALAGEEDDSDDDDSDDDDSDDDAQDRPSKPGAEAVPSTDKKADEKA